jgi:hypothetical protein
VWRTSNERPRSAEGSPSGLVQHRPRLSMQGRVACVSAARWCGWEGKVEVMQLAVISRATETFRR